MHSDTATMEIIVLDGDSDEGDHISKDERVSERHDTEGYSRPAKRQRQEPSSNWVHNADPSSVSVSHVSDTVQEPSMTEAPLQPGFAAADDAESPSLSPQQVCNGVMLFLGLFLAFVH